MKVGVFKRGIEDNCNKVVRALKLYFIKMLIKLLQSYINARFNKGIVFILKALLSLYKDLAKRLSLLTPLLYIKALTVRFKI